MLKTVLKLLSGSVVIIALQACSLSGVATPAPSTINTAIAQTAAAALTQTAQVGVPITGGESPTPTPSMTETPTATLSATPAFTATPSTVQVSVSVATNCRIGPGVAYTRVGALLVGQAAQVIGRNSDSTYWVIQNPNRPGELCWLWGQFATLSGNPGVLPVFTPPPPPPPTATLTPTITFTPMPATSPAPPTSSPTPLPSPTPTATP